VSWTVTIPGQPVSGNHANKIGRGFRRGGIAYPKMVKTTEAAAYQMGAAMIVRAARPSAWRWNGGQVVVEYRMFLTRDADCDNVMKVCDDAIFPALDINDKYALPRAMSKEIVKSNPRVEVTILETETTPAGHDKAPSLPSVCNACGAVLGKG
jgi:Holliday junction resolvase RusA-like endonuclease